MESKLFRLKRIRAQIWRLFPIVFLVISLVLVFLTMTGNRLVGYTKQTGVSFFAPAVTVLSKPVAWVNDTVEKLKDWAVVYHENERLKKENDSLLKWRSLALELLAEQKELRTHLNYIPPKKTRYLTAQIALDEGSAFTRSFVVDAGENQGVTKGMLAFSNRGLFARVVEVMPDHARIMMMTDYMSRVPVWVGENKVSALLIGDNTARPYLQFLNENGTVQVGDNVMTSGYVGLYPPGLIVGTVEEIQEEEVRVRPFENGDKLLFVRLVDFPLIKPLLKEEK